MRCNGITYSGYGYGIQNQPYYTGYNPAFYGAWGNSYGGIGYGGTGYGGIGFGGVGYD